MVPCIGVALVDREGVHRFPGVHDGDAIDVGRFRNGLAFRQIDVGHQQLPSGRVALPISRRCELSLRTRLATADANAHFRPSGNCRFSPMNTGTSAARHHRGDCELRLGKGIDRHASGVYGSRSGDTRSLLVAHSSAIRHEMPRRQRERCRVEAHRWPDQPALLKP